MCRATSTLATTALVIATIVAAGCGSESAPECPAGPPIAADDRGLTARGTPVGLSLVANDVACGGASLAIGSLDLDPATAGAQQWLTTDAGGFLLDCTGDVWFSPMPDFRGDAALTYTITDSEGQVSAPARVVVTVGAD